ncbi:MAG TPA: diguanylate cyclase [Anaeromyxobacteraceae bacterium]|jgi:diguanylate cyclase (GGDEF)-like protein
MGGGRSDDALGDGSLAAAALQLVATLDPERLVDETLRALARATDAQGAALWIADERGQLALRGTRGLVDRAALAERLDPRAGDLAARFQAGEPFAAPGASAAEAFQATLAAEGEAVGLALLADRARGRFGETERAAAQALCRFAAVAMRNARRVQALERASLRDRDSGAYNLAYFVDYAGKEFYKSRRYGRSFSLAVIEVEGAAALRRGAGAEAFRAAMRAVVAAVSRAARDADVVARVSDAEYQVLLPETDAVGARMFARRAAEEVRRDPAAQGAGDASPRLAVGAATFPRDGEDFEELLHRARHRQAESRGSMARSLPALGPRAFWELADLLLGDEPIPEGSPSARRPADPELMAAALRESAREIGRDPRGRGLLYLGSGDPGAVAGLLAALPAGAPGRAGDGAPRVGVVAPAAASRPHPLVSFAAGDGDLRLRDHAFVLLLTEHAAYALLEGPGGRAFHTADPPLVDALAARLQALHGLEPV